jgi:hypothetical protein
MLGEGLRELPGVWGDSSVEMLPQKRHRGRCRLCGNDEMLTREHIPPGAALNLGPFRRKGYPREYSQGRPAILESQCSAWPRTQTCSRP